MLLLWFKQYSHRRDSTSLASPVAPPADKNCGFLCFFWLFLLFTTIKNSSGLQRLVLTVLVFAQSLLHFIWPFYSSHLARSSSVWMGVWMGFTNFWKSALKSCGNWTKERCTCEPHINSVQPCSPNWCNVPLACRFGGQMTRRLWCHCSWCWAQSFGWRSPSRPYVQVDCTFQWLLALCHWMGLSCCCMNQERAGLLHTPLFWKGLY